MIYSAQLFIMICLVAYLTLNICRLYCLGAFTAEGVNGLWDTGAWREAWEQMRNSIGWQSEPDWDQV